MQCDNTTNSNVNIAPVTKEYGTYDNKWRQVQKNIAISAENNVFLFLAEVSVIEYNNQGLQ